MLKRAFRRGTYLVLGLILFAIGLTLLAIGLFGYFSSQDVSSGQVPAANDSPYSGLDIPVGVYFHRPPLGVSLTPTPVVVNTSAPLRIAIPSIGVDASVITLGLEPDGVPEVPDWTNSSDPGWVVAWYDFSAWPGSGSNAVLSGHVTWDQSPAIFWSLKDLQKGDVIKLVTEEGKEMVYEVSANFAVDPDDPDAVKVMAPTSEDIITLITCGGTWLPNPSEPFGGNYSQRIIIQAKLASFHAGG